MLRDGALSAKDSSTRLDVYKRQLSGDTAAARLEYIVRDHDREKFEARKELLRGVEKAMTEKYPTARVEDVYKRQPPEISRFWCGASDCPLRRRAWKC